MASKLYRIEKNDAGFQVDLIGEIVVSGFPTFDSAAAWLREFIMTVVSGQLTAMIAAQHTGKKAS
jgi:hypothetical protein